MIKLRNIPSTALLITVLGVIRDFFIFYLLAIGLAYADFNDPSNPHSHAEVSTVTLEILGEPLEEPVGVVITVIACITLTSDGLSCQSTFGTDREGFNGVNATIPANSNSVTVQLRPHASPISTYMVAYECNSNCRFDGASFNGIMKFGTYVDENITVNRSNSIGGRVPFQIALFNSRSAIDVTLVAQRVAPIQVEISAASSAFQNCDTEAILHSAIYYDTPLSQNFSDLDFVFSSQPALQEPEVMLTEANPSRSLTLEHDFPLTDRRNQPTGQSAWVEYVNDCSNLSNGNRGRPDLIQVFGDIDEGNPLENDSDQAFIGLPFYSSFSDVIRTTLRDYEIPLEDFPETIDFSFEDSINYRFSLDFDEFDSDLFFSSSVNGITTSGIEVEICEAALDSTTGEPVSYDSLDRFRQCNVQEVPVRGVRDNFQQESMEQFVEVELPLFSQHFYLRHQCSGNGNIVSPGCHSFPSDNEYWWASQNFREPFASFSVEREVVSELEPVVIDFNSFTEEPPILRYVPITIFHPILRLPSGISATQDMTFEYEYCSTGVASFGNRDFCRSTEIAIPTVESSSSSFATIDDPVSSYRLRRIGRAGDRIHRISAKCIEGCSDYHERQMYLNRFNRLSPLETLLNPFSRLGFDGLPPTDLGSYDFSLIDDPLQPSIQQFVFQGRVPQAIADSRIELSVTIFPVDIDGSTSSGRGFSVFIEPGQVESSTPLEVNLPISASGRYQIRFRCQRFSGPNDCGNYLENQPSYEFELSTGSIPETIFLDLIEGAPLTFQNVGMFGATPPPSSEIFISSLDEQGNSLGFQTAFISTTDTTNNTIAAFPIPSGGSYRIFYSCDFFRFDTECRELVSGSVIQLDTLPTDVIELPFFTLQLLSFEARLPEPNNNEDVFVSFRVRGLEENGTVFYDSNFFPAAIEVGSLVSGFNAFVPELPDRGSYVIDVICNVPSCSVYVEDDPSYQITINEAQAIPDPIVGALILRSINIQPDAFEVDNTAETASIIRRNQRQSHTIHVPSDVDFARFSLDEETTNLRIEVLANAPTSNMQVVLRGTAGNQIARHDDQLDGQESNNPQLSSIDMASLQTGEYLIEVTAFSPAEEVDGYTLILTHDVDDGQLCLPVSASNGGFVIICL